MTKVGLIERYRKWLPVTENTPIISLLEGSTPLIKLVNLPKLLGIDADWYVKYEGLNPTGSFKDRGMTLAVTKAHEMGSKVVMCASTGNTSAAAAAYAAKAGMSACVIIPEGKIALGKLSQAMMYGARILQISGNFDDALNKVREVTSQYPITLVNSVNPFRIDGQKTGAFEIVDALNDVPDFHFIPVGNAGNITAYWKGYCEYFDAGKVDRKPKMMGYQAAGSAPIVDGHIIANPDTIATAIRIGNPASWRSAEAARDESGGVIDKVSDEAITEAQQLIARYEGVFCEPASAASIAGVIAYARINPFLKGQTIVSVLTGNGLKDPNRAVEISDRPINVAGDVSSIVDAIGDLLG